MLYKIPLCCEWFCPFVSPKGTLKWAGLGCRLVVIVLSIVIVISVIPIIDIVGLSDVHSTSL